MSIVSYIIATFYHMSCTYKIINGLFGITNQ